MLHDPLAVWLDSYRCPFKDALDAAAADGFHAVYANATRPDFNPDEFGDSARRHLTKYLAGLGARLVGVAAEFPGAGLADPQLGDRRLAQLRKTLEFSADLRLTAAATRIAGLADPRTASLAGESLALLADAAERVGVVLAVHADGADLAKLGEQVERLGCTHLRLGLDSATFDLREPAAARRTARRSAEVWLRDARVRGDQVEETEMGAGDVDFARLLADLEAGEFRGTLTLRRDARTADVDALRRGRDYIVGLLARPR